MPAPWLLPKLPLHPNHPPFWLRTGKWGAACSSAQAFPRPTPGFWDARLVGADSADFRRPTGPLLNSQFWASGHRQLTPVALVPIRDTCRCVASIARRSFSHND